MARPRLSIEELEKRRAVYGLLMISHEKQIRKNVQALKKARKKYLYYSDKIKDAVIITQSTNPVPSDAMSKNKKAKVIAGKKRVVEV
jgi:hypothetical protein